MARARLNSGNTQSEDLPKPKLNKELLHKASKIFSYIKPYRVKFGFGMAFLIISSLTMLTFPALLGAMIDAAQGKKTYPWLHNNIAYIGGISFSILFIQSIISFFRIRLFVEIAEKALANIRRDTYNKLITLPIEFFANRRVGELNSRLSSDLAQIQDTMTTTLAETLRQVISLAFGVVLLIAVSPKLALMNLCILPILVVTALIFGRFIRNFSRQAQDQLADSNSIVQETLLGISNVKAFVNEYYETKRYSGKLDAVICLAVKGATYRGMFASFIIFCIFGAVIAVIWYGASLVSAGEISVGDLTTYILYSMFVAGSMGSFPELYANIQRSLGASERVIEILNEKQEDITLSEENKTIKRQIDGHLTFKNVAFTYPGRKDNQILKNISFDANSGEKIAIVGPSGTGKSTIASLILQFYSPDSGQILYDGVPSKDYLLTDIRNQVAIVPQDVLLFGGTIRENIGYGKLDADAEEIIKAARRANAHNFIMEFPEGYDTLVGERGVKLSGGQRQRIAIARALLKDPAILILDEATSALDSESERLVQTALEELMKNRTSIIIAHRLSTVINADKIIVVEDGIVSDMGNHVELMSKGSGLYHHLYSLQSSQKEEL
ncbi:ABC transporter ATP-binding protein [Sphingobacterium spiritivorum]|uniref:ABC transporter, ATP-binding protein n=1 Tax=Sphingobacterium spiritivorum ATCC 33861 TaxID=525373 RepID=D7VH64_SPHSI|nr:ABC transporter transmembrane domain-containing protein [Sphingobacterium spiritivorum]EFK59416.1 ABC transporter, ATP-binding protein [Sphingobacterium spiritivorum ATCC 33861]QQT33903.1 ATP-binding cassette domain-containing protein [Sphingobacterium spiritivorum]WQD34721.1 ABC transporter transmembrane domain-containing protein [Sphingobacterium spiritivorum]SUI97818.1 Putative multidrug export ATP-binding/permease protein SAV1866 [Sphingobacterium spiritivorum]